MSHCRFLAFGDLHHYPGEFVFGLTDEGVASVDEGRLSYARRSVPFIRDYEVDLEKQSVIRSRE